MFEWLIPILIVVVLLIKILDYLDMLEGVTAILGLIAAAVVGTVKLTACLIRSLAGSSKPQP
jgi:nucleoside permease NupC